MNRCEDPSGISKPNIVIVITIIFIFLYFDQIWNKQIERKKKKERKRVR